MVDLKREYIGRSIESIRLSYASIMRMFFKKRAPMAGGVVKIWLYYCSWEICNNFGVVIFQSDQETVESDIEAAMVGFTVFDISIEKKVLTIKLKNSDGAIYIVSCKPYGPDFSFDIDDKTWIFCTENAGVFSVYADGTWSNSTEDGQKLGEGKIDNW